MKTDRDTIYQAAKEGRICGECGRKLKPNDPVWRKRLMKGANIFGQLTRTMAPTCNKCREKEKQFERDYGLRDKYEEAKPCEGCGRPVHDPDDFVLRMHSFCSEVCQHKVLAGKGRSGGAGEASGGTRSAILRRLRQYVHPDP
jgi:hypothetical protein